MSDTKTEDINKNDGLPWEVGPVRCVLCGHEAVSITHFPTIRRNLECSKCGAMAMAEVHENDDDD